MNDTEQLFIAAAVWALIAAAIARFIPNWPGRIAFFAIAVGLPFWELPYGYYHFQFLCREGLDLKVFEKIAPQQIVCADHPYVTLHTELLKTGFKTVETRDKTGAIKKYSAQSSGGIETSISQRLESNYCLSYSNNNRLSWRVLRHDQFILRASDNRVVARQSRFSWLGMWWQEEFRPIAGRGGECSDEKNHTIATLYRGSS